MNKRKRMTKGGITGFVMALAISLTAASCGIGGTNDYEALVKTSEEMNKSFPMKVDNDTSLDSTNVQKDPLTLNYYYTIVTLEKQAITGDLKDIVEQLKVGTQKNLDEAPEMAEFRTKNISLKYCYYDKNGVFLVDYTIKPTKK